MTLYSSCRAPVGALLLSVSSLLQAALVAVDLDGNAANGHEGVYDTELDVTWLADANLALSNSFGVSGIRAWGGMPWESANLYVDAMNADNNGSGYLGVNTWRLPAVSPVNGNSYTLDATTYDGSTDRSYQLSAPVDINNPAGQSPGFKGSELAFHYYNNFEAIGECSGTGTTSVRCVSSSVYGIDDAPDPNQYKALFTNIENASYWSAVPVDPDRAIFWSNSAGFQSTTFRFVTYSVWPVAPGNVAAGAVPLPAGALLFPSALSLLWLGRRWSGRTRNGGK